MILLLLVVWSGKFESTFENIRKDDEFDQKFLWRKIGTIKKMSKLKILKKIN